MANIPSKIRAHAKANRCIVERDAVRDVAVYRRDGKDVISFNLADARANVNGLLKQLDRRLHPAKAEPSDA